jgi:murein DD-endopeptidase MepM/ murein hydrolase activator NlpD
MRYRFLLQFLKVLIYSKRFFWWIGRGVYFVLAKIASFFTGLFIHSKLQVVMLLKRLGIIGGTGWLLKRGNLQLLFFIALFGTVTNQTRVVPRQDLGFIGQKTVVYSLVGGEDDAQTEEVVTDNKNISQNYAWKTGSITVDENSGASYGEGEQVIGAVVAGGSAISKPIIMPGTMPAASQSVIAQNRNAIANYVVVAGDSLSAIASDFGISVTTILWENNMTARTLIRPGDLLKIPPVNGVMHTVQKGDTLVKIAKLYNAKAGEIVAFNNLKEDGSNLVRGVRIMIPNGVKQDAPIAIATGKTGKIATAATRKAAPPNSFATPGASGYIFPTASHLITQYFGFKHHALDIGGPWQTPIYATKSGTIIKSQCGWNSGYGCYIIIDHGSGVKSLYGHNSQLLVAVGDEVETGQTIALMGNTGHVRGVTGIHSHFEIIVNGARVNPLGYVK